MIMDRIMSFKELVDELSNTYSENGELIDDEWAVFYKDTDDIKEDTICCIADIVEVSDDYEEIYPDFAVRNEMDTYINGELLNDVLSSYLSADRNASASDLIYAINYYLENDCFIELECNEDNNSSFPQVMLDKEISDKRVLLKIRKAFSLEIPLNELLILAKQLPFVITNDLPLAEAKRIIKNNNLEDFLTIKF